MVQKRRRVQWAKAHLKLIISKWNSVLWSESKFDIIVENHGRRVLRAKEEGDLTFTFSRCSYPDRLTVSTGTFPPRQAG